MNKLIIVGAFSEIVELAEDNGNIILGFFDNLKTESYFGYPILGTDELAVELVSTYKNIPLVITPDNPIVREMLYFKYLSIGYTFLNLVSKEAKVSKSATIAEGAIVQSGVNISSESYIGKFVKLNTNCNVMHNCRIEDFTTVAPNAVILGYISIGKRCYIGSNATILPNITITDDVTIGAGSVVTRNIYESGIYIGSPAKFLKK